MKRRSRPSTAFAATLVIALAMTAPAAAADSKPSTGETQRSCCQEETEACRRATEGATVKSLERSES